ncbi:MAG: transposase [Coriobacteriia bacterium]|nr:transposase [Coriobacteriia bacterium]
MPHVQRIKSETGFYHVVIKGDGGQIIFESDADRLRFLEELAHGTQDYDIFIHAYCLMANHVHLLMQDPKESLSAFMKQLEERYAMYFRKVTGRVGHVFRGRFWSEPIDSDERFLATLRYIHANPEPPGMCRANEYRWSSYQAYMGAPSVATTKLALDILGSPEAFASFHENAGSFAKPFQQSKLCRHLSYDELTRIAVNLLGREEVNALKTMKPSQRQSQLESLAASGFTDTQIARITGIGQSSVNRALHASERKTA